VANKKRVGGLAEHFGGDFGDGGFFGGGDTPEHFFAEADEVEHFGNHFVELSGFFGFQAFSLCGAISEHAFSRRDFATVALASDDAEHLPNVFFGLEVFFAVAFAEDGFDQAPTHEVAEVGVGIAAGNLQLVHNLIGGERFAACHEKGVNLSHRAVDSPSRSHGSPVIDKLIAGGGEAVFSRILYGVVAHLLSVFTESSCCASKF